MKRLLAIATIICLVLSLVGCSGSSAPEANNDDNAALEQSQETAENNNPDYTQEETREIVIDTNFVAEGTEATAKTGGNIAWDPEKMGGMPQTEGTTIFMEMDMTKTLGRDFAYSYSVTGLTKEVYQEYIKLAEEKFPKVIENRISDNKGSFMALTEDNNKTIHVKYIEGNLSYFQYID